VARTFKIVAALVVGLGIAAGAAFAGISTGSPSAQVGTSTLVPALNQPNWDQLTPEQRAVLNPLASDWPAMESYRRKKWIGIAQRYSTMSADEKSRVDQRMKQWASLTPEQRRQARANYKSLKQVTPDHKEDIKRKWEEYSQLPVEQRERLKAEAAHTPPAKSLMPLIRPLPKSNPPSPAADGVTKHENVVSPTPGSEQTALPQAAKAANSGKP
jgi:hypothetical protein